MREATPMKHDFLRIYRRMTERGECIIMARIRQLGTGGVAFETSLFGEKPYELNMNMPTFSTAREADAWIMRAGDWRRADEA